MDENINIQNFRPKQNPPEYRSKPRDPYWEYKSSNQISLTPTSSNKFQSKISFPTPKDPKEDSDEIKHLKLQIETLEQSIKANDTLHKITISNIRKEKEILDNDKKNLLNQIESLTKHQNEVKNDDNIQLKEHKEAVKKLKVDYELEIKELKDKNESLVNKLIDLESKVKIANNIAEMEKSNISDIKEKYTQEIEKHKEKINELKTSIENERNKYINQLESKEKLIKDLLAKNKENDDEILNSFKVSKDLFEKKAKEFEKLYYQEKQKNEFLNEQNNDLNEQITKLKNNQEKILLMLNKKDIDDDLKSGGTIEDKIESIQNIFSKEKNIIENNYNKIKDYYDKDMKEKESLINTLKADNEKYSKEINEIKSINKNLSNKINLLESELKHTDKIRNDFNEELSCVNRVTVNKYEDILNAKELEHHNEIEILNKNSENILNQMKEMFSIEKKRLEDIIQRNKGKFDKDKEEIIKEYENKIKDIEHENQNEIDNFQLKYNDIEAKYNTLLVDSEHNIKLLNEKNETNEKIIADQKENIMNLVKENNHSIQEKINQFNKERKELADKIESLQNDIRNQEEESNKKNNKINELNQEIADKENSMMKMKNEYDSHIDNLISKFNIYKQKQSELTNEFYVKKMEFERERNLLKQQIDYLNKRYDEQRTYVEENTRINNDGIMDLKNEFEENFNNQLNKVLHDKKELNDKLKEAENQIKTYEDKINALCNYYETKINDEQANHKMIYQQLENELKNLSEQTEKLNKKSTAPIKKINELLENQSVLQSENLQYKNKVLVLQKTLDNMQREVENLTKEKGELVQEVEQLNSTINNMKKSKTITTSDLHKRFKGYLPPCGNYFGGLALLGDRDKDKEKNDMSGISGLSGLSGKGSQVDLNVTGDAGIGGRSKHHLGRINSFGDLCKSAKGKEARSPMQSSRKNKK